ncbi:MAG TPA: DUF3617 domain-containing protein [Dissulfurispiraceae bacterium]|nr:DUF3617 domain-containing protein [Dissulfurispiraceae bacterium]
MRTIIWVVLVVAITALTVPVAFAAPNMQDGLWEITTTVEMKGMPSGMMKPMTHTSCLTHKDSVPEKPAKSDCKMSDMNSSGNTVTWTMTCPDSVSKGNITYSGSTFEGTTDTTVNHGGQKMQVRNKMKGKRIGPCK